MKAADEPYKASTVWRSAAGFFRHGSRFFSIFLALALICLMRPAHGNEISVELRTFIAHGEPADRGISCVVVNNTRRDISVWKGYDGERNQLRNEVRFPLSLRRQPAPPLVRVTIAPGTSETLFTLSLDAILFLNPALPSGEWGWGYAPGTPVPRGAPPISPLHPHYGLGWEIRRGESATLTAQIEVDGEVDGAVSSLRIKSKPLDIRVDKPRFEEIKAMVRFDSAQALARKDDWYYEIRFTVVKAIQGTLKSEERTMTLPSQPGEQLMREAGVRSDDMGKTYTFASPTMTPTFARMQPAGRRPASLILTGFAKK